MIRKAIIVVLLLCAGGTVFVRYSGRREWDIYHSDSSGRIVTVDVSIGELRIAHEHYPPSGLDPAWHSSRQVLAADRGPFYFTKIKDSWFRWPSYYSSKYRSSVTVPLWMPLLLFVAYPINAFIRGPLRLRRRRKRGLCLSCGYNLTGNVSGVCPECATKLDHLATPRAHTRRIAKWMGLVTCSVIAGTMVASHWWCATQYFSNAFVQVASGGVAYVRLHDGFSGPLLGDREPTMKRNIVWVHGEQKPIPFRWRFDWTGTDSFSSLVFPFWIPLLAVGVPTLWLWRRDRRLPAIALPEERVGSDGQPHGRVQ